MFKEDIKRIKACINYNDYYSALEYAILKKEKYKNNERKYLEIIIKFIKEGKYEEIRKIIKN